MLGRVSDSLLSQEAVQVSEQGSLEDGTNGGALCHRAIVTDIRADTFLEDSSYDTVSKELRNDSVLVGSLKNDR